ncbi:MAG: Tetratricopeptide repeat-containing protein [Candidatus Electronema aureum]|uniref:Tetratricopeptide repeat-containing protein n=1 Tax=Candidatus Electronema aureum TaxID=2005002 RepID=A0A521G0V8_9BACT|nr:MAG: Tetratricopeptide repeat-containing protein [Candidatus Electronema aureum]
MSTVNQHIDGDGNVLSGIGDVQSNSFDSHGGTQNIAQGDGAIACQINNYGSQPAPPPIPRQPPAPEPCFLHREEELVWLNDRLHPGKVVAVCGPGGMGKSALAAQAVSKLDAARFPDGIVFHSFYGHPKTETALRAICEAFQIEAKADLESAVRQVLAGKRALLFLDGTEEAKDLPAVLRLRSSCGVLITTRSRKDAQGVRLNIKPLEDEAAAQVFREYSKVAGDDESVVGICKILGGWPVALRIAGNYVSSTEESAATYLKWLAKEPFRKLGKEAHQQENAALLLRRSVAQISTDAVQVLRLVGILAFASISLEPVMAVLSKEDEDQDDLELRSSEALGELVNYGLLDKHDKKQDEKLDERWQISHALVHTYARTELAMSKESLERLAAYYIEWCEAQSKAGLPGYARLDGERAHCLRLIESCLASKLWQEVSRLVGATYIYLDRQGHWAEKLAAVEMNLTAAQQAGNRKDEGWCLCTLGYTCWRRGKHEKAIAYFEQCLPIDRELGDRQEEGVTLNNIAAIYQQQGKYELTLQQYQQSLSIQREIGDRKGEGSTLNNIGILYREQGDNETALRYYEQCLHISREAGDKILEGQAMTNIGVVYRAQGNPAKALEYYEQALAIWLDIGDRFLEAVTRWWIALTYEDRCNLAPAEEHVSQAVQIMEVIGHPSLETCRKGLAQLQAARQGR